jgi:hypothetical protein
LVQQLAVCLFNQFLIDILQERLLSDDIMTQRTALQYLEQMLDIFTNSTLVKTVFHFLVGLPKSGGILLDDKTVSN